MDGKERNRQINVNLYIMPIKKTTEEFINEAKSIYGDEYSFEQVEYVNNRIKVAIGCKKHRIFYRNPLMFLRGYGCPYCSEKKHFYYYEEYMKLLKERYGDIYSITEKDFNHRDKKQCARFKCEKHGYFKTKPAQLLTNCCCKECNREKKLEELKHKTKDFYGVNYEVFYNNETDKKINVKCKKHNIVTLLWKQHLFKNKFICSECYKEERLKDNEKSFFKRANELYNGFYSYKNDYTISQNYITAICPIHGEFKVTPNDHLCKHSGCPKCGNRLSNGEDEIFDYCKSVDINTVQRDKSIINPYELDIYIPSKRIAIEYNGLTWHSEQYKQNAKEYHLNKTTLCKNKNIKLIHIFEDEWLEKNNIVKSIIKCLIRNMENEIKVSDCEVRSVSSNEANNFLEHNYIKGKHNSAYRYGLYYNNELILLATFKKKSCNNEFELQCFCNKLYTKVAEGDKKLLNTFIENVNPRRIVAKADKRFSDGNELEQLGFINIGDTQPNYYYCNRQHRENKFKYAKKKLVEQGFDKDKTEHQIMNERGFYRIYDCGETIFELSINT